MGKLKRYKDKIIQKLTRKQSHSDSITEQQYYSTEKAQKLMELESVNNNDNYLDEAEFLSDYWKNIRNIYLNDKVDEFIDWYYKYLIKGNYTNIGEFHMPNDMRNFIEKMAVWYELRYPDYEINRLMPGSSQEAKEINDVMFNSNKYINELFDENADIRLLEWDEFYNAKTFINSLSYDEKCLLKKNKYTDLVYLEPRRRIAHLHLTSNGFINESEGVGAYTNFVIKDKDLEGMHIKNAVKLFKEKRISLPKDNELSTAIKRYENSIYQKEEMLNCVMYRIIERGGNRIGPRRAFLFAKEFGRNIDVPMMYAVDYSDPGLRRFIIEYIKAGGKEELQCYVGYFSRTSDDEELDTVTVKEILKAANNNCITKYTPEEIALYQRMVNAISSQIDYEEVKKEEIKHLRLQKRLNKSRTNK